MGTGGWAAQPGGDVFVVRITSVGTEVGSSGAGTGYVPHGFQELMHDPATRTYVDNPLGRVGTTLSITGSGTSRNCAYSLDGGTIPVGTICFARLRGPSGLATSSSPTVLHDKVYDILSVSGAGNLCIEKVLFDVCWNGATLRKVYQIKQGCTVLASLCEDVGACTDLCSGGGGGGTGPDACPCEGLSPDYWNFTLSTVTDDACTDCESLNQSYCLAQEDQDCAFQTIARMTLCGVANIGVTVSLGIFPDGSAGLAFVYPGGILAVYYLAAWDCNGPSNVMTLLVDYDVCTWPATITLYSDTTDSLCTDPPGGGHDCTDCGTPDSAEVVIPTTVWVDGACTACADMDNGGISITLTETGADSCVWTNVTGPGVVCGGTPTTTQYSLSDNGIDGWEFYIVVALGPAQVAKYFLAYAAWNCAGANVMNYVSGGTPCTTVPTTVSVTLT